MLRDPKDVAELIASCWEIHPPDGARAVRERDREVIAEAKRVLANEKELVLGSEDGRTPGGFSVPLERALAALDAILKEKE